MIMKKTLHFLGIIVLLIVLAKPEVALAENGMPNSAEFGYGVRLDLSGAQINPSIAAAGSLKLNWLALNFDWAGLWPTEDAIPDLEPLSQAVYLAQQNHLSVMISITKPPAWVVSSEGPDPAMTAKVVNYLARTYSGTLLAIELFPGANTIQGWGTTPNPNAYLNLMQTATNEIQSVGSPVIIVAAGLTPLSPNPTSGDMDDLAFLDALYIAGAQPWMPIVGMRMLDTTGDPTCTPTPNEKRCLRHFEEVRQIMLNHNHRNGLIWLTGFAWPSGNLQESDGIYREMNEQTRWLNQSYQILKAQLYIGVAFFSQINPPGPREVDTKPPSLIRPDLSFHPALANIGLLISPPADNTQMSVQTVLVKRIVQDIQFKPTSRNAFSGQ
jgi:hypothetical protein